MNPNKALWEKGDFTEIAAFMRESGEVLVKSLGITTPMRILDLGCGDGTTALPLARLGQLLGLAKAQNKGGHDSTSIPATFMRVTVSP